MSDCVASIAGMHDSNWPHRWEVMARCSQHGQVHHASGCSYLSARKSKQMYEIAWEQGLRALVVHEEYHSPTVRRYGYPEEDT